MPLNTFYFPKKVRVVSNLRGTVNTVGVSSNMIRFQDTVVTINDKIPNPSTGRMMYKINEDRGMYIWEDVFFIGLERDFEEINALKLEEL